MNFASDRLLPVLLFVVSACAQISYAQANSPSADELPAACRAAKADFRPLSEADLQATKTELLGAIGRLDQRLNQAGENGENWRKFLQWDRLQSQLQREEGPDLDELQAVYKKYSAEHHGLGLIWFVDVRQSLLEYLVVAQAVDNPQLETGYANLMEDLAKHLEAYLAKPSAEEALVIGDAIRWLQSARQAPQLIQAIEDHFVHPNLFLMVSADVISAGISESVDDTVPVRDMILGTSIHGTGHTIGQTSVEFFPDEQRGVIDTILLGTVESKTIGYHGPVRIYSNGTTRIGARKRLWVDANGLASHPAVCNAVTTTEITCIRAKRDSRLIEKAAWKRAGKQKCLAEQIAARHAETRVSERVDQQAAEMLDRANEAFQDKFRKPLKQRKLFPQQLQFRTSDQTLQVVTLRTDGAQLAAPTTPPELIEEPELALRMHESLINNLANSALSGMLVRSETLEKVAVELLGEVPERFKAEEDQEPWAVGFARRQPVSIVLDDGGFSLTIRGRKFYKGEDRHPGMNVTAVYKLTLAEEGIKAIRQGELQIHPPGFVPGSGQKLSSRQVVIRKLLQRRFDSIFKEELLGQGLELPGKWSKAGKMKPVQLICEDGWLTVAWKAAATDQDVAQAR